MGPNLDEFVGPDMVGLLRPQTDTRTVVEPETPPLRLLLQDLQPLPPPNPCNPLHVHDPASVTQQGRDPPIALTALLRCESDDVRGESLPVGTPAMHFTMR